MASADDHASRPALEQAVSTLAADLLAQDEAPGAAIALWRDGVPLVEMAVGSADLAGDVALTANARFPVYSVTKTLIAVALLRLAERGVVGLDEPLQAYLPDIPLTTQPTLRQVLLHTAGLPDYGPLPEYQRAVREQTQQPWSDDEFVRRTLKNGELAQPGSGFRYSNLGYMWLRLVLQRVTGGSFAAALAAEVFEPLGLRETYVAVSLADMAALSPGYSTAVEDGDTPIDVRPLYHPGWVAHGLVISTAHEIAVALDGLFAGRLLKPESLAVMLAGRAIGETHPLFAEPAYGLGLMMDIGSATPVAGHTGGGPGYSIGAYSRLAERERLTSVALVNRDIGMPGMRIATALLQMADRLRG